MHQDFYEGALKAEIAKPQVGLRLTAQPAAGEDLLARAFFGAF